MRPAQPKVLVKAKLRGECFGMAIMIVLVCAAFVVRRNVSAVLVAQAALTLLFLVHPVVLYFAKRPIKRRYAVCGPYLCQHCGYDLRGIDGECCPECGTPFDPAANEAAWRAWLR